MLLKLIEFAAFFGNFTKIRGVAQLGRALTSGVRGRRFESSHPDHDIYKKHRKKHPNWRHIDMAKIASPFTAGSCADIMRESSLSLFR